MAGGGVPDVMHIPAMYLLAPVPMSSMPVSMRLTLTISQRVHISQNPDYTLAETTATRGSLACHSRTTTLSSVSKQVLYIESFKYYLLSFI